MMLVKAYQKNWISKELHINPQNNQSLPSPDHILRATTEFPMYTQQICKMITNKITTFIQMLIKLNNSKMNIT